MFCFLLPALTMLYPPATLPRVLCVPEIRATAPVAYLQGGPFMEAHNPPASTNPLDAYAAAPGPAAVPYTYGPFMSAYDVQR